MGRVALKPPVDENFIERVLDAAQAHGEFTPEPEQEVGDLQQIVRTLWSMLTTNQKRAAMADESLNDLIVQWLDSYAPSH